MLKKRMVCSLLALVLALSVSACGNTDDKNSSGTSDGSQVSQASTESSEGADGSTVTTDGEKDTFKVVTVRWTDAWPTDFMETGVMAELEETHNVDIQWDVYYYGDWNEQKSLLLASGDLPDAFFGSICLKDTDIAQNSSYFLELTDLISTNMPNLSAILEEDSTMKAIITTREGEIKSLPKRLPLRPEVDDEMFINKVWLDNLNLEMPTTYLELQEVLVAFATQDPNGNGEQDEYGYDAKLDLAADLRQLMISFGTAVSREENYMGLVDGEPVFMPTHENYYEAVQWVHELYEQGALHPECFTMESSMETALTQAEGGSLSGLVIGWTADAEAGVNAGEFELVPTIAGPSGNRYAEHDPEYLDVSRNEFLVTTACENPGKLLQWADSFYTDEVSLQTYYGSISDGLIAENSDGTYEVLVPEDGSSLDTSAWSYSFRDFGPKYMSKAFESNVILPEDQGDGVKLAQDSVNVEYITETFPVVAYTNDQAIELANLSTTIYDYAKAQYAHWVVDGGVEEEWDAYLEQLDAMGLQELLAIQTDAYNAYIENIG